MPEGFYQAIEQAYHELALEETGAKESHPQETNNQKKKPTLEEKRLFEAVRECQCSEEQRLLREGVNPNIKPHQGHRHSCMQYGNIWKKRMPSQRPVVADH